MKPLNRLVLRRPDDWHVHLRDGAMLEAVLSSTARVFSRAVVMPNLRPPSPLLKLLLAIAGGLRPCFLKALDLHL